MKQQWVIAILATVLIGGLAGCDPLEMLSEQLNNFLSQEETDAADEATGDDAEVQAREDEPEEDVDLQDETGEDNTVESGTADESEGIEQGGRGGPATGLTDELPFDDLLRSQGYDTLSLPNGFPISVPYHWILVGETISDEQYTGKFCYELPLSLDEVTSYFDFFDEVTYEQHGPGSLTSTFSIDYGFRGLAGTFFYYEDEFNNSCVDLTYAYESYGEDPSSMVSDEELAEMGITGNDDEMDGYDDAGDSQAAIARHRTVPADYDALMGEFAVSGFSQVDFGNVESIRDKIQNGQVQMLHLLQGYPKIFPYEWYLMEEDGSVFSPTWTGTYCTDFPFAQSVIKHHEMLADHEMTITDFDFSANGNQLGFVDFSFNDEYGTGSWHGSSEFYLDGGHQCINVEMTFSDELLD